MAIFEDVLEDGSDVIPQQPFSYPIDDILLFDEPLNIPI
jgi:hypothetical protein